MSNHSSVWLWGGHTDQKPQPRLARRFARERLHGQTLIQPMTDTDSTHVEPAWCKWKITCFNRSMYSLFATAFNQFFNRPNAAFDASGHSRRHADRAVDFAEVIIREIQGNGSLKVFKLFTECICEARQSAAMHT